MSGEKLTPKSLAVEGKAINLDGGLWQMAALAHRAKEEGLTGYDAILGALPNVRRKPRTVREWAQGYAFYLRCPKDWSLPFSFYTRASRYVGKVDEETIFDAMDHCAETPGADVETVDELLRGETQDEFDVGKVLEKLYKIANESAFDAPMGEEKDALEDLADKVKAWERHFMEKTVQGGVPASKPDELDPWEDPSEEDYDGEDDEPAVVPLYLPDGSWNPATGYNSDPLAEVDP